MTVRTLVWIRRISQALFLAGFIFLCIETRIPQNMAIDYSQTFDAEADVQIAHPVDFFFQLDPLLRLAAAFSGYGWIKGIGWTLLVLALTLLMGRVFCGFVCPMGTLHHLAGTAFPAWKGKDAVSRNGKSVSQRFKYAILAAILLAAVFGLNMSGLLDPLSLLFRSLALAIFPGIGILIKELFDILAASDIKALNLISYAAEMVVSPLFGYGYPAYQTGWILGLILILLLAANRRWPRFWCRTLCPLGALLGVFSRFSVLKLVKDSARCTGCNRCLTACQGATSPKPDMVWNNAECLVCLNCMAQCPEDAIRFQFGFSPKLNTRPDVTRRTVLAGLIAGLCLPILGRLDGSIHVASDSRLIRPPGAVDEKEFLSRCLRCGLCMKVCPTNAINPALSEAGMGGFWTPVLIMNQGYCEFTCTLCSSVCPSGAIGLITGTEKREKPIRIGSASVDRGKCLPWSGNGPCIVCQELCPTSPKAIYLREETLQDHAGNPVHVQLPHVSLKHCVGCGICENKCPIRGRAAIRVMAAGESRTRRNQILLNG